MYHKIIKGNTKILATYAHEWTHYIQYLSTFLGNFLADNERNIHFAKHALVILVSKALAGRVTMPVLDLLYSDDMLLGNSEIRYYLKTLEILVACQSAACQSWSEEVRGISLSLDEIRERRPFKIENVSGSLVFTCADGRNIPPLVSATQILEHAAIANELMLKKGVSSRRFQSSSSVSQKD